MQIDTQDADEKLECEDAQKDQVLLLKLLYNYVTQMVCLYQDLLDKHGLKDVHIKPYNILESHHSLKVYDLHVTKHTNPSRNDNKELFHLYKHMFVEENDVSQTGATSGFMAEQRSKQPGRGDLWDLAQFIYWLCTRERLFDEEDDFDYFILTKQVIQWRGQRRDYQSKSRSSQADLHKQQKFDTLPT